MKLKYYLVSLVLMTVFWIVPRKINCLMSLSGKMPKTQLNTQRGLTDI